MAVEIRQYTALVPAGTPATAPQSFDMSFPPRVVDAIELIVPPGPSGLVGFAVLNSGVRVIPYLSDQWIITASEQIRWPLDGYITSGAWSLLAYNTGTQDHSIFVRFLLSLTQAPAAPAVPMIDNAEITPGGLTNNLTTVGGL